MHVKESMQLVENAILEKEQVSGYRESLVPQSSGHCYRESLVPQSTCLVSGISHPRPRSVSTSMPRSLGG